MNIRFPASLRSVLTRSGSCLTQEKRRSFVLLLGTLSIFIFLVLSSSIAAKADNDPPWREIDTGLFFGEFEVPEGSGENRSAVTVLRIDPAHYAFRLLCASEYEKKKMTVREWSQQYGLVAAVNAGMYQADGLTSVGYMKNFGHLNNPGFNKNRAVLAFNAVDSSVPEVQIIDRNHQNLENLKKKYNTLVQSIRMISADQKNVWNQQPEKWSTVAIGIDKKGRVLFLFTRTPYSVHDFVDILLSLPLSIYNAMYLEGGPQASFYVSANGFEFERYGKSQTGLDESDLIQFDWPIPNVIGVIKK